MDRWGTMKDRADLDAHLTREPERDHEGHPMTDAEYDAAVARDALKARVRRAQSDEHSAWLDVGDELRRLGVRLNENDVLTRYLERWGDYRAALALARAANGRGEDA